MSSLYAAAERGDVAKVAALLDEGVDPNEGEGDDGTTALTVAAFLGHVGVVRLLLDRGADVDRPNKHGSRPLAAAARNAKAQVITMLLRAGASLTAEGAGATTAFMEATSGSPHAVRAFLAHGVDVNAVSSKGYTALQCAAINSTHGLEVIRLLLEAGADPAYRDPKGLTARDLAVERGRNGNAAALDAAGPIGQP